MWCYGTLHLDSIEYAESSRVAKSIEIITFTNRCCSPSQQKSRAFSLILAILGTGKGTIEGDCYMEIVKAIVKQATATGRQGVYVKRDGRWFHLRWTILGFLCDYAATVKLAQRGHQNSDSPCFLCGIQKEFNIPFISMDFPHEYGHGMASARFKILPSSHHCTHPLSNTRKISGIKKYIEWSSQSLTCGNYIIWDKHPIPTRIKNGLVHDFVHFLNQLATATAEQRDVMKYTMDILNVIKYSKNCGVNYLIPCGNSQGKTANETNKKEQNSFNLPAPIQTQFSLDAMHAFKNFFVNISILLNNEWKVDGEFLNDFYYHLQFQHSGCPQKFEVPEVVNCLAMYRLDNLPYSKRAYWIDKWLVLPGFLNKMNSEKIMVYFLCLFNYAYQDCLDNPVVSIFCRIVNILSELYCLDHNQDRVNSLQSLLSSYLGQLESIVPPYWRLSSNHIMNHLSATVHNFGPLYLFNNFNSERSYREVKNNNTRPRYLLQSTRNREGSKTLFWILSRSVIDSNISVDLVTDEMKDGSFPMDMIINNLIDDYYLSKDPLRIRHTYLDDLIEKVERWRFPNTISKGKFSINYDNKVEPEIRFSGSTYTSCNINKIHSLKSLAANAECICCTEGRNSFPEYFIVCGYVVAYIEGIGYPLAVCYHIQTESMSNECRPYHYSMVMPDWNPRLANPILISLRRITMGVLPLWFQYEEVLALSIMKLKIPRYLEITGDPLMKIIDTKV